MFSTLQPHRPKYPSPHPSNTSCGSLQHVRLLSDQHHHATPSQDINQVLDPGSSARPRNQLEAMPPVFSDTMSKPPATPPYNPATRHPVFFTPNLRKPPFPLPAFPCTAFHPAAAGYVSEQTRTTSLTPNGNGVAKL